MGSDDHIVKYIDYTDYSGVHVEVYRWHTQGTSLGNCLTHSCTSLHMGWRKIAPWFWESGVAISNNGAALNE